MLTLSLYQTYNMYYWLLQNYIALLRVSIRTSITLVTGQYLL